MADTTTTSLLEQVRSGHYVPVLTTEPAKKLIESYVNALYDSESQQTVDTPAQDKVAIALSAFNTFLQINVTGPVPDGLAQVEEEFTTAASRKTSKSKPLQQTRKLCFSSLDVDGVSVYQYIPSIELFCLARWILSTQLEGAEVKGLEGEPLEWLKLRVDVWHYKLITQPSLGSGSIFNKSLQWCEVPSLQGKIEQGLKVVEEEVTGKDNKEMEVKWLVEKANVHIMLGQDAKAKEAIQKAAEVNKFQYMLSGALGKRTKFQEKATSQLVVLAKSAEEKKEGEEETDAKPKALELNDDTLLEDLQFTKGELGKHGETDDKTGLPAELKDLEPDAQPQLSPLDQIILLTEATLKDAFSPSDTLTAEEILPFAVRVINDKSTNWQIYTQALLVRSRIEMHRSRTIERGVLQMQAVVDQVIVDTTAAAPTSEANGEEEKKSDVPAIKISADGEVIEDKAAAASKPTSFFPAAKPEDSAPAHVRLQYIHALSSPPRWHLESELAYSWAGVGSLVSALEIFKRLRLWAEVALCLAANARHDDEDGRGAGGEEKGRAIVRWRLFHRTGVTAAEEDAEADDEVENETLDISNFKEADFQGPERVPPPPNAPRLFCILGEMEDKPEHYERAWDISGQRYARAQKSLGEYWLSKQEIFKARDAYRKAVVVNRMSSELWNRLGDISLRLGDFAEAAESFSRGIAAADPIAGGEDARTWSNLGSSLYSLYVERVKELKAEREAAANTAEPVKKSTEVLPDEDDTCIANPEQSQTDPSKRSPATLLSQSLAAYKRGASIANDNWRIWDNVITLAARVRPPAVSEIILALNHIIKIRSSEDALDIDVLDLLLKESVLNKEIPAGSGVYDPPRGSQERAVCELLEKQVALLITKRHDLWELLVRARVWKRDYAGAIDAAERAYRAAISGASAGGGLLPSSGMGEGSEKSWLEDQEAWETVVERTDRLVSLYENYGEGVEEIGAKWKGKAGFAVRSVMRKAKEAWEGSKEWDDLVKLSEELKA
ncbi:hypothetical protein B0H65DRAFT_474505 [Neurospora tetraspora]|uniref:TPR repeat-containing protein n=1 Tax=Neurospora tetraspora TaxID=94610 RepID=A0AAE0MPG3_9PEZI|nr:hypothetical protein B0H65DRAFT_474505 [Neurospora tetraspora]